MRTLRHWLKKILVVFWKDISNSVQISWAHLKAIWWLKYLLLTIVAIVALAVWAQGARIAEDPNSFAKWLYKFLDDWAITLGAAVTFMLAVAAFLAILDNRQGRRADRRERLLNEIIEWATDVARCGLEKDLPDTSSITDMNEGKLHLAYSTNILAKSFQSMRGRNKYITQIALTFGQDLQEAIETLAKDVEKHIKLLDILYAEVTVQFVSVTNNNLAEYMSQIGKTVTQIGNHKLKLEESANKIIEEACKIKAKDIS